jgi:ribosomal protein S6--L-glutamate ligase
LKILSYHPLIEGDENSLCAGRVPGPEDLFRIQGADAVILPQGCKQDLYEMAAGNCPYVFPNYDARFRYSGKMAQTELFRAAGTPHPKTRTFPETNHYRKTVGESALPPGFRFPLVFKHDWGDEGLTVWLIKNRGELAARLRHAEDFETTGQKGFLLQEYVPAQNRSLRIVVMGKTMTGYWRVHPNSGFYGSLSGGGAIDRDSDPHLRKAAMASAKKLCHFSGINLAAFDVIFSTKDADPVPYFLEINYFFGRKGLGGSDQYYFLLESSVREWIEDIRQGKTTLSSNNRDEGG